MNESPTIVWNDIASQLIAGKTKIVFAYIYQKKLINKLQKRFKKIVFLGDQCAVTTHSILACVVKIYRQEKYPGRSSAAGSDAHLLLRLTEACPKPYTFLLPASRSIHLLLCRAIAISFRRKSN